MSSREVLGPVILRSVAALGVAAGLLAITPQTFGSYGLRVHVRWSADTTPLGRQYLERRLHLTNPRDMGELGFRYALTDDSTSGIRALVMHPAIVDTHYIDREAFAPSKGEEGYEWVDGRAGRSGRVFRPFALLAAWLLAAFGVASAVLAVLLGVRPAVAASLPSGVRTILQTPSHALGIAARATVAFLQRGIPVASAEAAGAFRIAFGACALAIALRQPVGAAGLNATIAPTLSRYPWIVDALMPALIVSGVLFIVGAATRISYAAFTTAFIVWATVLTLDGGNHATASLAMALLALLPSRWGDGLSVDAWRRPRARAPGRGYGYSIWAPGFMLGIAFAAAAWSKVKGGPAWIANGTVKYHFLTDAKDAYLDWGVQLTRDKEAMAIAMSAAAVIAEGLLITAAFSRSRLHRSLLAVAAALLFAGFALFQGVIWPAWWVLFLSFLPWERFGRAPAASAPAPSARATPLQIASIVAIVLQQVYVSGVGLEVAPLLSAYDMYSASYDSLEQYQENLRPRTQLKN